MLTLMWVIIAYFVGSIPFGLLLARAISGTDPRKSGSGNIGATNVARTGGKKAGVLTLLFDLLKGLVIVCLARAGLFQESGLPPFELSIVALAVVCGHIFSIFLRGKGGKGIATYAGVMIGLAPWQGLCGGILCLLIAWRTGFVSLGALVMVCTVPLLFLISGRFELIPLGLVLAVLIFWTHRQNIQRLAAHTEKPWNKNS